ncbi:MAG TPA: hypothetical protein VGF96_18900 [Terracidiphilus sp.]|jgi:hypothetical protein
MKRHTVIALMIAVVPALAVHAKDKKPSVSPAFDQARTVYVEAQNGQQFDRNLDPDDRKAIADVQDLVQAWKRYKLVTQREDADIVIVVRKGRTAGADDEFNPNGGPSRSTNPNGAQNGIPNRNMDPSSAQMPGQQSPGAPIAASGVETSTSQDVFEVCQVNANGKLTRALWSRAMDDGLNGPRVMLFQQFKDAVEKAYPSQPAAPENKP